MGVNNVRLEYVASGFMHDVYRSGGYAYKCVKDSFPNENNREHFEREMKSLELLKKAGFPAPCECMLFFPGEIIQGKWVMRESWIEGNQYRDGVMPLEMEKKVFDKILGMAKQITGSFYGPIGVKNGIYADWREFLKRIYEDNPITKVACPKLSITQEHLEKLIDRYVPPNPMPVFVSMDTNLMNFFFDEVGEISGVTDIEHPIFGDYLFLLADIRWCRDHWFHREDWFAKWISIKDIHDLIRIDIYEFLIAYQEIAIRYISGTSHISIDNEFYKLEKKLLDENL